MTAVPLREAPNICHAMTLALRERTERWAAQAWGPDGVRAWAQSAGLSVIVTRAAHDTVEWTHASVAYVDHDPGYELLKWLHATVFGDGWAF